LWASTKETDPLNAPGLSAVKRKTITPAGWLAIYSPAEVHTVFRVGYLLDSVADVEFPAVIESFSLAFQVDKKVAEGLIGPGIRLIADPEALSLN
jgi:hypothetical protein